MQTCQHTRYVPASNAEFFEIGNFKTAYNWVTPHRKTILFCHFRSFSVLISSSNGGRILLSLLPPCLKLVGGIRITHGLEIYILSKEAYMCTRRCWRLRSNNNSTRSGHIYATAHTYYEIMKQRRPRKLVYH